MPYLVSEIYNRLPEILRTERAVASTNFFTVIICCTSTVPCFRPTFSCKLHAFVSEECSKGPNIKLPVTLWKYVCVQSARPSQIDGMRKWDKSSGQHAYDGGGEEMQGQTEAHVVENAE